MQAREPGDGKARGAIRAIADARQLRDENSALQQRLQEHPGLKAELASARDQLQEQEEQLHTVRLSNLPHHSLDHLPSWPTNASCSSAI